MEPKGTHWTASMDKKEKDQILKEAFETSSHPLQHNELQVPIHPKAEAYSSVYHLKEAMLPIEDGAKFLSSLIPPSSFPENELLVSNQILSFTLPPEARFNLFEHLPKDLIVLNPLTSAPLSPVLPLPLSPQMSLETPFLPAPPDVPAEAILSHQETSLVVPLGERPSLSKPPSFVPAPRLPQLPSLDELHTSSYSDAFDAELVFSPREEGGYIFALTLIPRTDLKLTPIRQNYLFLVDRSNSIQRERLIATRNALRKALEELNEGDTFNIFVFDSKIEKLSPSPLRFSKESLAKAETFLDRIELGSFFSQSDLFKPLFLTIPAVANEDELYTAILITDGENLGKKGTSHSLLSDWTRYNGGKVSLYALGMNGDAHLAALDAACAFNRGKAFSSPTQRGLRRKLLKLMKTIHEPVAKNISCRAFSRTPQSIVEIFPKSPLSPHLYLNEPYIILGQTDTLDDFILFVQGRLHGEWLHIKKTISFLNGKKGGASLKKEYALQRAYELYEQYLVDQDPNTAAEARSLLEPLELQLPFE